MGSERVREERGKRDSREKGYTVFLKMTFKAILWLAAHVCTHMHTHF